MVLFLRILVFEAKEVNGTSADAELKKLAVGVSKNVDFFVSSQLKTSHQIINKEFKVINMNIR